MTSDKPVWFDRALNTPSERGDVDVLGARIHYEAWGAIGRPGIVLVHGSNAHLEWWRFVAPFLADRFRVAALDLSGNGDSGWRDRYSGAAFAEETFAVAKAAQLGPRPFVVGHSFGGFVALETAHRFGAELGGLVLADFTVSPPEAYTEWGMRAEREAVPPRRTTRVYADLATALGRFRLLPEQPIRYPHVIEHVARKSLREVEGGYTWKFDPSLFDHLEMGAGQRDKYAGLRCRSALVLGEHSTDDGAQSATYMSEMTNGILPILTIPETHHHMMFDEPIALAMAIAALVGAWVREDRSDELKSALARFSRD